MDVRTSQITAPLATAVYADAEFFEQHFTSFTSFTCSTTDEYWLCEASRLTPLITTFRDLMLSGLSPLGVRAARDAMATEFAKCFFCFTTGTWPSTVEPPR